jgi:hypothetical protein
MRSSATAPQFWIGFIATIICAAPVSAQEPVVVLQNNQPFRIHMPIIVRGISSTAASGGLIQAEGSNGVFIADVPANSRKEIQINLTTKSVKPLLALNAVGAGVDVIFSDKSLGKLSWDLLLKPVTGTATDDATVTNHEDFRKEFTALPLRFQKTSQGPIFETWTAEATKSGLKLTVELQAYGEGFLDLNARLTNESADEKKKVYAAVICQWEQADVKERSLCYDNRIAILPERGESPFRGGEGRHQFTQRGVDWVRGSLKSGVAVAWLNDFAPSFTVLDNTKKNSFKQERYEGASLPQLGQEVQTDGERFYSITEIARSNIRSYRDRLAENTLPAHGEGVAFTSRLAFSKKQISDKDVDQMFVGYTSYNEQRATTNGIAISFGVDSVRFGTSYLPYSTLGENFDTLKLPGMDREAFWPLAADTVLRWREFADDIRRDLRIAKFMGFHFIRLHHLELLAPIPTETREEYLDFIFNELRHLKLQALVDVDASDAAIVRLLQRYGDVIDTIEIENEILIWGIPLDRPAQWKATYAAIKKAAPQVRVHLTGYNNTGMFNRLESLGVPFDRVGLHSYMDSLDAIPTARGYALALGSYCSKIGKPPVITEWNWRQFTRMTPEARAKIYPAIFDNALATRAIPEMYQFQFNETMAPNPRAGRGNVLRHYELINLSRRPKPEAFELMKLIQKYSSPDDALRLMEIPQMVANLDAHGEGQATVKIKNISKHTLKLTATIESSTNFTAKLESLGKASLKAGGTLSLPVRLKASETTPGFYHCFVRIETEDGKVRYGWVEARLAGAPRVDKESKSAVNYPGGVAKELDFDLTQPVAVVFGPDATVLEVETAFAIASTLESATGRQVDSIQSTDFKPARGQSVILVGTPKSNPLIKQLEQRLGKLETGCVQQFVESRGKVLAVSGEDSVAVEHAGMDLLLRWWKSAKDSAARKIGLVEKELPRGGDAAKLP